MIKKGVYRFIFDFLAIKDTKSLPPDPFFPPLRWGSEGVEYTSDNRRRLYIYRIPKLSEKQ